VWLRAERVIILAGLLVWAAICLDISVTLSARGVTATDVLGLAALASFGPAFAWVIVRGLDGSRPRVVLLLVGWLALCGMLIESDLAYIVAMVLACVFAWRVAVVWLIAINVLSMVQIVATPGDPVVLGAALFSHVSWQVLAFAVGVVATTERQRRAELTLYAYRLRSAHDQLAERAREGERLELARELHDAIGHHLAALNVQLELTRQLCTGDARSAATRAHETGTRLLHELREVVGAWRESPPFDLADELMRIADGIATPKVHLAIEAGLAIADTARAKALLRCAQEGVSNALRHADADEVWIQLVRDGSGVCLAVRDDGRGHANEAAGRGLRGLRERAEALGGRLRVEDSIDRGVCLEMWLPDAR
jgi:signal transduction histidine kinase